MILIHLLNNGLPFIHSIPPPILLFSFLTFSDVSFTKHTYSGCCVKKIILEQVFKTVQLFSFRVLFFFKKKIIAKFKVVFIKIKIETLGAVLKIKNSL